MGRVPRPWSPLLWQASGMPAPPGGTSRGRTAPQALPGRVPRAGALRWRIRGRNPARRPLPCRCGPQGPAIEALMRKQVGAPLAIQEEPYRPEGAGGSRSRAQRPMSADGSAWDATGGRWSAERTTAGRSTSCVPAGGATAARRARARPAAPSAIRCGAGAHPRPSPSPWRRPRSTTPTAGRRGRRRDTRRAPPPGPRRTAERRRNRRRARARRKEIGLYG